MSQSTYVAPLRLGFIGGSITSAVGYTHWVASQLDHKWQVVSGCFSRDETRSKQTGAQWQLADDKIYWDWSAYIESEKEKLDAVVVLTPTPNHSEVVCRLLEEGVAVICEKAMAATLEQSLQIKQTVQETSGFLAVTFNYSGYPLLRDLRRHVEKGTLGTLKQIQIEMPSDGFIQAADKMNPQPWRLHDGPIPTVLLDLAVHVHHLVGFLTNLSPVRVNADFHHDTAFENIIDDAYLWVQYPNQFRASMWVSKSALGYRNGLKLRLFGDQGSAEWVQEEPERLHLSMKDSTRITYDRGNCVHPEEIRERFKPGHPSGFVEAFGNLYSDMADALLMHRKNGTYQSPYVFGWEHANEGLELLAAASVSSQQEKWIDIGLGERL